MLEAGQTEATVSIGIVDDTVDEGMEQFSVSLTRPSAAGVYIGAIAQANVTIIDNDGEWTNEIAVWEMC